MGLWLPKGFHRWLRIEEGVGMARKWAVGGAALVVFLVALEKT